MLAIVSRILYSKSRPFILRVFNTYHRFEQQHCQNATVIDFVNRAHSLGTSLLTATDAEHYKYGIGYDHTYRPCPWYQERDEGEIRFQSNGRQCVLQQMPPQDER